MPASLLYEATQALTKEELSALGSNGLLELCALDRRFHEVTGKRTATGGAGGDVDGFAFA